MSASVTSVTTASPAAANPPGFVHLSPNQSPLPRGSASALLLDATAAGPADRVLILGAPSVELLCEAVRHGCRAAQEAATPPKRPEPADVVLAPQVATEADAAAVAACARLALAGSGEGGRLALLLPMAGTLVRRIGARLHGLGFDRIRLRPGPKGGLLLLCQLQPTRLSRA